MHQELNQTASSQEHWWQQPTNDSFACVYCDKYAFATPCSYRTVFKIAEQTAFFFNMYLSVLLLFVFAFCFFFFFNFCLVKTFQYTTVLTW